MSLTLALKHDPLAQITFAGLAAPRQCGFEVSALSLVLQVPGLILLIEPRHSWSSCCRAQPDSIVYLLEMPAMFVSRTLLCTLVTRVNWLLCMPMQHAGTTHGIVCRACAKAIPVGSPCPLWWVTTANLALVLCTLLCLRVLICLLASHWSGQPPCLSLYWSDMLRYVCIG